jgi:hypothetical protein
MCSPDAYDRPQVATINFGRRVQPTIVNAGGRIGGELVDSLGVKLTVTT